MKVLMLNGSARKNGNTYSALSEIGKALNENGIDFEIMNTGDPVRDCIGCGGCTENGCRFDDDAVNEFVKKAREADGFIFGTPVYYAHPSGRILSFLDRAFYSSSAAFAFKPAASVACARRGGTTASFDALNKYFGISNMFCIGSTYWNNIHGGAPGEALKDEEGLQTMRNLGRNMAYILKCMELGKGNGIEPPNPERTYKTSFIR